MIRAVLAGLVVAAAARAGGESRPIFLRGTTSDPLAIDLDAAATIDDVKHQLYELEEIPLDEQRLVYAGKGRLLAGDERLAALGGAMVLLFRKTPGREPRVYLETPELDSELRKYAVSYDYDDGTRRVEYVNGTVAKNRPQEGKTIQTEPDGSTYEYAGFNFPGPPTKRIIKRAVYADSKAFFFSDGAMYSEFFNGTTAAAAPLDGLGRLTHANGSVVVSYFKGLDELHTRVRVDGDGLAIQEFADGASVPFNESSPTYRAFVDMWGSSFHGMLDAETFRLVVEDDFRVLAFMSRVVRSTWLLYVYFVLVFLGQVVTPFYWKASAAWWASGPARRRALDACRTWTGLLATLVCCAVGGSCLSALGAGWISPALNCLDAFGYLRTIYVVTERLYTPFEGTDGVFAKVGLPLRSALLMVSSDPLPLAKCLTSELLWPANFPDSTHGWAAVAVRACLAVVGASLPGRLLCRNLFYGSAAHSITFTQSAVVAATIILPSYPKLCIAGAGELLVFVCRRLGGDGLDVLAPVVRGVLWPARAVNTLEFTDLGALCKRGARAFGKAVNEDDVQEADEDESGNDDAQSEEAAPRGGARSIRCVATGRLFATMAEVQQYAAETGLTSFEEATESGTAAAGYWWLYAVVAAAVFYWHVPPSFVLWPLLTKTWGYAVGMSHCFCVALGAFGVLCLYALCPLFMRWPVKLAAVCGFNYLWYQLGGPLAAAWRVESYLRPVGWYGSHALLVWQLGGSFFGGSYGTAWWIPCVIALSTLSAVPVLDGLGDEGTVVRFVARELTGDDTSAEFLLKSTVETIRFDVFQFLPDNRATYLFRLVAVLAGAHFCATRLAKHFAAAPVVGLPSSKGFDASLLLLIAVVGTDRIAVLTPRFYGIGRAVLACRVLIGGHAFLLGGRTFDERCDDLEGALGRRGSAAAARLRRSRLFGAASSPAKLILRGAACAVAAANIIRGLPDGGGVLRLAYEFAEGALCCYCVWKGYRFAVRTLGYLWVGLREAAWHGWATDLLLVWDEVGKILERPNSQQWSANVQMVGVLVLIFKALGWFWFVGPYEAVQKFAAAMAAAALWTTTAVEYVATALERHRERKAARAQARQAEAATQELLGEEQRRSEARRARAEAAAAEARAARVEPEPEPEPEPRPRRRRRPKPQTATAAPAPARASTPPPAAAPAPANASTPAPTPAPAPAPSSTKAAPKPRREAASAPAPTPSLNRKARRAAAAAARAATPAVTVDAPAVPAIEPGAAAILRRLGLERLEPTFAREMIDAETLPLLAVSDLTDVGVPAGDAERIVAAVAPAGGGDTRAAATESHPENLSCPISMELMREPVLAADGFTYDRHAIAAWLARGKTTSPTTGAPLAHTHLTPNHLVKSMIAEYQSSSKGGAGGGAKLSM